MSPKKILTIFGTRPEAIKMAPLVRALEADTEHFESIVCVTAQHRQMLDQVLRLFDIHPQYDLDLMKPDQDLFQITVQVLNGLKPVLEEVQPDVVLVHGDTTTTMAASMAAFYKRIPVGHIEAGLRTFDKYYPYPEELNRVVADFIADYHFVPTEGARENLIRSGVPGKGIHVTGNTVIDALFYTLSQSKIPPPVELDPKKRLILVTTHRRENFGEPLAEICRALKTIHARYPDVEMVLPVHPNPNVRETVFKELGNQSRIHLIDPVDYQPFCRLMEAANIILTDSGGIQEEAPSLSKPVLVLRRETERPEAVEMGTVKLVGPDREKIIEETSRLLDDPKAYEAMAHKTNPYGDGKAVERVLEILRNA